jgi:hypothetical protein
MEQKMTEYFAHVLARMIVGYLTLFVISLLILVGYWGIADYNSMLAFMNEVSDNAFAEFVILLPFVFSWFKPDKRGNATEILNARMHCSAMRCSLSGRW